MGVQGSITGSKPPIPRAGRCNIVPNLKYMPNSACILLRLWYNIGMLSLTLTLLLQLTTQQQELVDAIIMVESNGNDDAVGDNGSAIGCLQIWEIYHTDAVERSGIGGSYKDCYNRAYAIKVFDAYMCRYAREAWTDPKQFDAEKVARIHNGGPRGYRKDATKIYWKKVLTRLMRGGIIQA